MVLGHQTAEYTCSYNLTGDRTITGTSHWTLHYDTSNKRLSGMMKPQDTSREYFINANLEVCE
jgi:hypothetical protein